jgi:hypothetical protein
MLNWGGGAPSWVMVVVWVAVYPPGVGAAPGWGGGGEAFDDAVGAA